MVASQAMSMHKPMMLAWSVLEIAAGHWPFSDKFQHLADQTPFWLAKFTVHFQWDRNHKPTKFLIFKKTTDQFMILISTNEWSVTTYRIAGNFRGTKISKIHGYRVFE